MAFQFNAVEDAIFKLFPQLLRPGPDPIMDIPDELFYPAFHHVHDCLAKNRPIRIHPGKPLDNLRTYLVTTLGIGPAP